MKEKGYGLLHRKFFDHPFWQEARTFSKAEAWLDIVFCLTRGTNDSRYGLKRGEFRASLTWLATRWNWDKGKVQRFMVQLTAGDDPMVKRIVSDGPDIRVYGVCKFEKYQNPRGDSAARTSGETLTDTPVDTPNKTPDETPKAAGLIVFTSTHETRRETPNETPPETLSETKEEERINTGEIQGNRNPSAAARALDEAFEIFTEAFADLRSPAKYPRADKGGFVQLAKLRTALEIGTKATPPDWAKACQNYLVSSLGNFTLADLCVRYGVFVKYGLDRFNKPIGASNGQPQENPNTRAAQDFVHRELAKTVQPNLPDVRKDTGGFS